MLSPEDLYPNDAADTVVVVFPAMGVPASYYGRFATSLVEQGLEVFVASLEGSSYRELSDHVGAVLASLEERRAGRRTVLLGHSLGGQVSALHLARSGAHVDGLIFIAVGIPYWRVYGHRGLGVLGFTQSINAVSLVLRHWPGWGFGGRQPRGVIRDWAYTGRHGHFPPRLGARFDAVDVDLLSITVENDQYTPPATTGYLVGKLSRARVTRARLTTADAGLPLDHFKWVKAGAALGPVIQDWLSATSKRPLKPATSPRGATPASS
jgi:predicted alpha/beta hydrolase